MSETMVVYFLAVLVAWIPSTASMRTLGGDRIEQLLGGLILAVVWPLSVPALSLRKLHRSFTSSSVTTVR